MAASEEVRFRRVINLLKANMEAAGNSYCINHHINVEGNAWDYLVKEKAITPERIDSYLMMHIQSHADARKFPLVIKELKIFYKSKPTPEKRIRTTVSSANEKRVIDITDCEENDSDNDEFEKKEPLADVFEYEKTTPFFSIPVFIVNMWETVRIDLSGLSLIEIANDYVPSLTPREKMLIRSNGLFGLKKVLSSTSRKSLESTVSCDVERLAVMFQNKGYPKFSNLLRAGYTDCANIPFSMKKSKELFD
jgi:hypothetical protein